MLQQRLTVCQQRKEKIWRCECGGNHYLSISYYSFGANGYLQLEAADHHDECSIWGRLKAAWQIIQRGQHLWFGILLNLTTIEEVITELESSRMLLEQLESKNASRHI